MSGSSPFTAEQLQAAAAQFSAAGLAPPWWGRQVQQRQQQQQQGSPRSPSPETVLGQQAVRTASAAQQAWLSRLPANQAQNRGEWGLGQNSQGQPIYVDRGSSQTPTSGPNTNANANANANAVPSTSTPTIGDVSQYLQGVLSASGAGSSLSDLQLAQMRAGSADAAWRAGLTQYRLGNDRLGSYTVGSIPGAAPGPAPPSAPPPSAPTVAGSRGQLGSADPTNKDFATSTRRSNDIDEITYSSSINDERRASGPIVTLLDLTNRDIQENDMFPVRSELTWFTRDQSRRVLPFAPVVQETALRGPGAFGQRFSFDLGSIMVGDLLLGTALQIRLDHWLDPQTQNVYTADKLSYLNRPEAWEYANSLGTSIIQLAELEIDGKTLETIDGDFINTFSALFPEYNTQVGVAYDHLGQLPSARLLDPARRPSLFSVENGNLNCILPFFFMRTRLREALPMIAMREGFVKIHITLRPFDQCVRQMRGYRDTCSSIPSPIETSFTFQSCRWVYDANIKNGVWDIPPPFSFIYNIGGVNYDWNYTESTERGSWSNLTPQTSFAIASLYFWSATRQAWSPSIPPFDIAYQTNTGAWYYWLGATKVWRNQPRDRGAPPFDLRYGNNAWTSKVGDWSVAAPPFKSVQLLTYGAIVDGSYRSKMLREPFEILHRQVQTFYFDEPLKYSIGKRQNAIRIQLPLEANHPIEEIIWFVRRKGVSNNNEWANYSSVLESERSAPGGVRAAQIPMLSSAMIQANGTVLCDADEQFYREGIASAHRGGFAAYSRFIYGYSFAKTPGEHQPSGSMNASKLNSLRLVLDVLPPMNVVDPSWEVKVFCIGMNWLRFENGLANPMFDD